ncbi:FAD-binding oxidoreductase [Nakamurella lactea]|uniref:FAD-binding oxidoreductase n=1 Tax=Nakamurella lactea TaxID=459515 RepID=UPI00040A51C6|nr:FAD-binding oxidoreductase [Nakamurella lactea]
MSAAPESAAAPSIAVIEWLREEIAGDVVTADSADYDTARRVYSGTADLRPVVVVRPATAADVQAVVGAARDSGLELAVRGGGHSAAGHGTTEGGIALDLSALKDIDIDPVARVARVGAGLTAGEFVRAAGKHGLATGFGDTESVGIGGITVGGGLGLLSRKYGMTIDALLGAELVTADGQLLTVDAEHHPDLFWAIRGGGSNFGVITRFTFRLSPVDRVVGGLLVLPAEPAVLAGFLELAGAAPDELTTIVAVMPCPPLPFVPPQFHGQPVLLAQLVFVGDQGPAEEALAPFRALAEPLADLIKAQPYPALFPPEEMPRVTAVTRTQFLDSVDASAAATIISAIADSPAPMRLLQLRVLGGQISRVAPDATAFGFRDKKVVTYLGGFYAGEENRAATTAWADELVAALDQGDSDAYANFVGEPGQAEVGNCYPPATLQRLGRIKQQYDPTNLFRRNHNIAPFDQEPAVG